MYKKNSDRNFEILQVILKFDLIITDKGIIITDVWYYNRQRN